MPAWSPDTRHGEGIVTEVDLEFLGRQIGLLIEGQREIKAEIADIKADLAEIKAPLADTASRDLLLRVLQSFAGQVELAEIRTKLLQETLTARRLPPRVNGQGRLERRAVLCRPLTPG
jgi:hypothetical protein